jgi:hypothetical protein
MSILTLLDLLESLVTRYGEDDCDDAIEEEQFFLQLSAKLKEICNKAREENMDSEHLISLLNPFLLVLTNKFGCLSTYCREIRNRLNAAFSSIHLSFSLQKKGGTNTFFVACIPIKFSIENSIMYQTNAPTNCMTFLEHFVRLYPEVATPVIQFWILSMGIFEDIFATFGDVLKKFYLPPKVPEGHTHPFRIINGYREYYKFDLFDQIFTILNKSVSGLELSSNDFHCILSLLKKAQTRFDEKTLDDYPRDRLMTFYFLSALIGFQLRDMLSSAEDKEMVTEVLKIKKIEVLKCNVKDEIQNCYWSIVSAEFFRNPRNSAEVDFTYLRCVITDFGDNTSKFEEACDALIKFYDGLK